MVKQFKSVRMKVFISIYILMAVISIGVAIFTVNNRILENYEHLERDSISIAKGYSHSLTKATKAKEIINELLDNKLTVASVSVLHYNFKYSNDVLKQFVSDLDVDQINLYNDEGVILYSNIEEYVGWEAYENHPVYDFMISSREKYVEEIRKDSESDSYYKYGYYKLDDGSFVQIGVLADKVQYLISSFEIQSLLEELQLDVNLQDISFVDQDYKVVGSTDKQLIGSTITDSSIITSIKNNEEFGIFDENEGVYTAYVPVYLDDEKIGTLMVCQLTKGINEIVKNIIIDGTWIIFIILLLLGFSILYTYHKSKKQLRFVYYDSLTNIPNLLYFKTHLADRIKKNIKNKAILVLNCSNFSMINLTHGYEYGDYILKYIANQLTEIKGSDEVVFRVNSDRFILYVENYANQNDLILRINQIISIFTSPVVIHSEQIYLSVQVGVVEINDLKNVDQVLKDSSIVLSHININDSNNFAFFNEKMELKHQREKIIELELRHALKQKDKEKIYLVYQPQIDLKTDEIVGFEALARMKSDALGSISPLEFIPIAEKNQLIIPLGNLIIESACEFINQLCENDDHHLRVSVNISGIQLLRNDFIPTILNILEKANLKSPNLDLEITESILLDNYDLINEKLSELRRYGIKVQLDDFGTGYSSFARLKELNIDVLKIDRYFISRIPYTDKNKLLTPDIISMAHKLGLKVIAEGVEVNEQKEYLQEKKCDIGQGYLFSKPLSEADSINLLKKDKK